jgi:hypothetical protein
MKALKFKPTNLTHMQFNEILHGGGVFARRYRSLIDGNVYDTPMQLWEAVKDETHPNLINHRLTPEARKTIRDSVSASVEVIALLLAEELHKFGRISTERPDFTNPD